MTHNEIRSHWFKEGAIGLGVGVLYGLTSITVGHPIDTIKTKMQGQHGFEKTGMVQTCVKTLQTQGIRGFYRGCIPPFLGSGIFRSLQFAVFEGAYTFLDTPFGKSTVPLSGGIQVRVLLAGAFAATCRAVIETPLEYAKVRGQVNRSWMLRNVYTGFGVTCCRTQGLLCTYFMLVDSGRRHFPEQFQRPLLGPFLTSGIAATLAWWIVWPVEYMKCQVQSGYGTQQISVIQRMWRIMRDKGGFLALYRGIWPGTIRSFLANGISMTVMANAQRKVSEWGLRD
ncbi:mitochondrial ornithine transporter 2-like [Argonauta hians]